MRIDFHATMTWAVAGIIFSVVAVQGQQLQTIKLSPPNKTRGRTLMETLAVRASATEWSERELNLQDLSDLLWAANGVNRPEIGKRTAPSAQNAQDVDIYVFNKDGAYLYDAREHALVPVATGDLRIQIAPPRRPPQPPAGSQQTPGDKPQSGPPQPAPAGATAPTQASTAPPQAPVILVLVTDVSRFRAGTPELKREWGAIDVGIVSQNISLFCASTGLATRPKSSMDREKIRTVLNLTDSQYPLLNHPVGYPK